VVNVLSDPFFIVLNLNQSPEIVPVLLTDFYHGKNNSQTGTVGSMFEIILVETGIVVDIASCILKRKSFLYIRVHKPVYRK
jgi:hypothetical protein